MTTLHALRRAYTLSFSELAMLTSIPARRLAEFEYQGDPLSADERRSLAALFGIAEHALEGGFIARQAAQPTLTQAQAKALVALAAVAALAWNLRLGQPQPASGSTQPALAAFGAGAQLPAQRFTLSAPATEISSPTATPTASSVPTAPATVEATPTLELVPSATSGLTPTSSPTAPATAEPTGTATPTEIATETPTPTKRPVLGFRLAKRPTPTPPPAKAAVAARSNAHQASPLILSNESDPSQCPVVTARGRVVLTQGYGTGSHQPAAQWGAVDLAIGGGPTQGATVVATHSGYVLVALNSWPGGNFVSVVSDTGWRTGYAHLETVVVESGQYVQAGTPIGTVGSTGSSTGPHLHYETWHEGVNLDPSPRLFCR